MCMCRLVLLFTDYVGMYIYTCTQADYVHVLCPFFLFSYYICSPCFTWLVYFTLWFRLTQQYHNMSVEVPGEQSTLTYNVVVFACSHSETQRLYVIDGRLDYSYNYILLSMGRLGTKVGIIWVLPTTPVYIHVYTYMSCANVCTWTICMRSGPRGKSVHLWRSRPSCAHTCQLMTFLIMTDTYIHHEVIDPCLALMCSVTILGCWIMILGWHLIDIVSCDNMFVENFLV